VLATFAVVSTCIGFGANYQGGVIFLSSSTRAADGMRQAQLTSTFSLL
jgi:hypothetical protein